jgi:putative ABC transport system ATP-binding protein
MISVQNASKLYFLGNKEQVTALDDVSLDIPEREFVALMGSSGSGKSTLLNIIGGIDRPSSGKIFLRDEELSAMSETALTLVRRDSMGIIFQFFHLMPTLSVYENVVLPARLKKTPERVYKVKAESLLSEVGLGHRMTHKPFELSGGEMQRVAIARALINDPYVLLADEPTGNLDSSNGEKILELLKNLSQAHGITMLMATHSREAAACADRIVLLKDGRIVSDRKNADQDAGIAIS